MPPLVQAVKPTPVTPGWWRPLKERIRRRETPVAVVGLGYVGLPVLLSAHRAGFPVIGLEADPGKVVALKEGRSYITDVADEEVAALGGEVTLGTRAGLLAGADVTVICVPTPLADHEPDLSFVRAAATKVAKHLRPGTLVVLESTTYPGTTEEELRPILETSGLVAGVDFALAYAPERIDPGRETAHVVTTPRVVGGIGPRSTEVAAAFYRTLVNEVITVRSPREAEMAKIIENTFRHVNIGLMNELAMLSRDLGVDIWEAIGAAATKPFGYMAFWPGPGVGGHCIAIDPSYLSWRVGQRLGHRPRFIEHAQEVNAKMPAYVAGRIGEALNAHGKALRKAKVLVLGLTYKADVNDIRESPAVVVVERLLKSGATISYHDPFVPDIRIGTRKLSSVKLTPAALERADCVVILTPHSAVDYADVVARSQLVFDARVRRVSPPA